MQKLALNTVHPICYNQKITAAITPHERSLHHILHFTMYITDD